MRAGQALSLFLRHRPQTVLDIGCGDGEHTREMRAVGIKVQTVSMREPADYIGDYERLNLGRFQGIWASHVLEHALNVQAFLEKAFGDLTDDGVIAVTVPPYKPEIVGGHVSLWNAGLLLYRMILAGFDCSEAQVGCYDYNVSVVVKRKKAELPKLNRDSGDIARLARFFPFPVRDGFDGRVENVRWYE